MKKHLLALALIAAAGGANAALIVQASTPVNTSALTEIDQSLSFAKFDTGLGTLNSISISFYGQADSTVILTSTAAQTQDFDFGSLITFKLKDGATTLSSISKDLFALNTYTLAPGVPEDLGLSSPTFTKTYTVGSALFSSYEGAGDVALHCTSTVNNTTGGGGGNVNINQATTAFCNGTLTYDYTPTPPVTVPEPASMALVGLGMMGLAALRRRK